MCNYLIPNWYRLYKVSSLDICLNVRLDMRGNILNAMLDYILLSSRMAC